MRYCSSIYNLNTSASAKMLTCSYSAVLVHQMHFKSQTSTYSSMHMQSLIHAVCTVYVLVDVFTHSHV